MQTILLKSLAITALLGLVACSSSLTDIDSARKNRGVVTVTPDPATFGGTALATANSGGDYIYIYATCYQDGTRVYAQYKAVDEDNQATLTLGPTSKWTGGDADCVAEEGYFRRGKWHSVASTDFVAVDE